VYAQIANDMVAAREALLVQNRRDIRRVTQLEFARDLAPQAMDGYPARDPKGLLKELSDSFQNEVAAQVVDLEGQTLKLTGTAEEQYREWRRLLHQIYLEENGGLTVDATPAAAVPLPQAQPLALEPAN
jgi:hypothetical protein